MIRFLLSYTLIIYLAFAGFVLIEITDHPNPKDFAITFLTLWPLLFLAAGSEPFIHVHSQYREDYGVSPPQFFKNDWLFGMLAALSVALLSAGAFWLWHFTMWAALINVAIPILLPASFYVAFAPQPKRTTQQNAAEQPASRPAVTNK